ncbi:uncharacterized protein L203_100569 [Cryptococcus depauperatus CBS 7841]|uniref:Mannosyltransferase n=1 Tax=Cryptococcus depauperatus CBS 7841 TaxID=1295531 RepID=A0AAJ8LY28_9TREE
MLASESVRPVHQPAAVSGGSMSRGGTMAPSWDEQIVPALRRRLESEAAYLTHRLSATQFDDVPTGLGFGIDPHETGNGHSHSTAFPRADYSQSSSISGIRYRPLPTSSYQAQPRARVKSGPTSPPRGSRKTHSPPTGLSFSTFANSNVRSAPQSSSILPSSQNQANASIPPSRIPTRPRSKSQLAPRPLISPDPSSVVDMPSPQYIPLSEDARSYSQLDRGVYQNGLLSRGPAGKLPDILQTRQNTGRESPTFAGIRMTEGFIKNELPPFKMQPEEALRIAEKGYDLNQEERDAHGQSWYKDERHEHAGMILSKEGALEEGTREKRKRAMTMRGRGESNGHGAGLVSDQPVSQPTSTGNKIPRFRTGNNRPTNLTPSFSSPRSASYNALSSSYTPNSSTPSSSSRLGIAAHLIPPESAYTPPKGADWDEVVLPAVAKKLGMGETSLVIDKDAGEEDLAVEWDKDGTPIRWMKRKNLGKPELREYSKPQTTPQNKPSGSAFKPTFEPSPDNPFHSPSSHLGHTEDIELSPVRDGTHLSSSPLFKHSNGSQSSLSEISRKTSLLRKNSLQRMAHLNSSRSLRSQHANGSGTDRLGNELTLGPSQRGGAPIQPPTPGTTHNITDAIYEKHLGNQDRLASVNAQGKAVGGGTNTFAAAARSNAAQKKRDDGHGKGLHDVLAYGFYSQNLQFWDHVTFPGAVPRSFLPSITLGLITYPLSAAGVALGFIGTKLHVQILIRLVLATLFSCSFEYLGQTLQRAFGTSVRVWFTLLSLGSFHIPYYAGRTLPNFMALPGILFGVSNVIRGCTTASRLESAVYLRRAVVVLTALATVVRLELALFVLPLALSLVMARKVSIRQVVVWGMLGGLGSLVVSSPVDYTLWLPTLSHYSFPFNSPIQILWPELSSLIYNAVEGHSAEWGIMPIHYYLTNSLPKLLVGNFFLVAFAVGGWALAGLGFDKMVRQVSCWNESKNGRNVDWMIKIWGLSVLSMVGGLSLLGHKEWRFILPILPISHILSALFASSLWNLPLQRWRLFTRLAILSILCLNLFITGLMTFLSVGNYPGGQVWKILEHLQIEQGSKIYFPSYPLQTGATLFTFLHDQMVNGTMESNLCSVAFPTPKEPRWVYDKREDNQMQSPEGVWLSGIDYVVTEEYSKFLELEDNWEVVGAVDGLDKVGKLPGQFKVQATWGRKLAVLKRRNLKDS